MKLTKSLQKRIGELFIIGFPGERLPVPFLDFIKDEGIGGLILFEENCTTHTQARESIEIFKSTSTVSQPLIAIDQEGGRVSRLRGIPAEIKAAEEYAKNSSIEKFSEEYNRVAVYLESLGFNINLAPVADIAQKETHDQLKSRCYGSDPETVSDFVEASVEITRRRGLLCCLKHFPGLGAATIDPHKQTATADYDQMVWQQHESKPFSRGINAGADLVMTTHLLVKKLDDTIVTGSEAIINDLLRINLQFDGPIITDDLQMKGASSLGSIGERTVKAFNAGHDLLLFGRDYEQTMVAYDFFCDAYERGTISKERLQDALDRVSGLRFRLDRTIIL